MEQIEVNEIHKNKAVIRDAHGRLQKGTRGMNPLGRPKLGLAYGERWRKFLQSKDATGKRRERRQMELVYEISVDKDHKFCLEAIKYAHARAYGEIPKEISLQILAMTLLQSLPQQHTSYLAQLIAGDDKTLIPVTDTDIENEDTEEVNE